MGTLGYAQRRPFARGMLQALAALLVGIALVLGTVTTAHAADTVGMPNVVGKSAEKARKTLEDKGLVVKLTAKDKRPVIIASHWKVTKQSLTPDKQVKVGKKVTLTVKLKKKSSAASTDQVTVPNVTGMAGDDAQSLVTSDGLNAKFDAGEESVWSPSNWNVVGQDPAAGTKVNSGTTITLKVERKDQSSAGAEPDVTSAGLDSAHAATACDQYGQQEFQYGWKGHIILGLIAAENQGDHYFYKFEADVTNMYNAKAAVTVECTVGGSNEAPQVTAFNVY